MKPRIPSTARLSIPLASALAALFSTHYAQAQTARFWDNNAATGFGNAGGTWTVPTLNQWSTDAAGTAAADASVTTGILDPLNFGTDVTNKGLGGGTITVTGTVDAASIKFGSQTTATVVLSGGTINLGAVSTIQVGAGGNSVQVINSTITGAGTSLTKTGGRLALTATNNNYSGATNISSGALIYGNTGAKSALSTHTFAATTTIGLGVGGLGFFDSTDIDNAFAGTTGGNLGNVVLAADTSVGIDTTVGDFTYATSVAGSPTRGLTKLSSNTLTLQGANTFTGQTTIGGGTLRLENTAAVQNSSLVSVSSGTTLLLATDAPFAGTTPLSMTGGTVSSSVFTPGAGITHGFGNLGVSNATQNFTKGTDATGTTAAIQVASITNASGGGGNVTLNPTTANLIVVGGYTGVSNAGTNGVILGGTSQGNSIGGVISNGTRVTQNVIKSGISTWTLSGANTHNGATSVTLGTLVLANSLALQNSSLNTTASVLGTATDGFSPTVPTLTFGGLTGDKDLASVFITGGYSGVTALTLNPGTGVTHTYSAAIADGAADMTVTKTGAGTQILSGSSSYTGGTTVTAGILQPTFASALAFYNTPSEVSFNGGIIAVVLDETAVAGWSTVQVDSLLTNATKTSGALGIDTTAASVSFAPTSLSGDIGLTKLGANTLTLTSANTHTGTTTITATTGGTLRLENTGAVQNSAVVSISNRILEVATNTAFSSTTPLSMNGGTIVSDRATAGAGLTHAFGNLAVAHNTSNFTAGSNVTSGTAAIQVASMTCASGSGGSATLNPVGVNLIIAGTATGANTGTSTFNFGGTSTGNSIGGIGNGTRTTQNVIKSNTSTWALNGVNTYTGNTTVNNGTLTMTTAASASNANANNDASTVTISDNGTSFLNLDYTGTDVVNKLFIGAIEQAPGVYGSDAIVVLGVIGIPQITGDGTLTVGAGFSSWITGTFADGATVPPSQQGPNDDPDNDGISNLVEFAIAGQDPTVSNSTIGTFDGTTLSFTKRQPLASSLTYAIQESTDLGIGDDWDEVTGGSYVNNSTTISYTLTPGTPAKNFLRLQVISN